jgi:hypothetical protein
MDARWGSVGSDGYLIEPVDEKNYTPLYVALAVAERQRENEACWLAFAEVKSCFVVCLNAAVGMCVVGSDGRLLRVNDKLQHHGPHRMIS